MVDKAAPTEMDIITETIRKDARANFDALNKDCARDGTFTEWLEIGPLFQSMGIEFSTHDEFLELYNATTQTETKKVTDVKVDKDLFIKMILEKVNQTDPMDGIIAEIEA